MYQKVSQHKKWFVPNIEGRLRESHQKRVCFVIITKFRILSLLLYPLPLRTTAEAGILDGFGDKICEDLNKHLKSHAKDLNLEPSAVLGMSV